MKKIIYILFVTILFVQCTSDSANTEEEVSESVIKKDSVDVDAMIKRDQERFDSMKNALLESED